MHVEYKCEVKEILTRDEFKVQGITPTPFPSKTADDITPCHDWPVYVVLTNGTVFGCDLVVSATGVTPSTGELVTEGEGGVALVLAEDGGVAVDKEMRTNLSCVYAAGDLCHTQWEHHSNLWFQVMVTCMCMSHACQCLFPPISSFAPPLCPSPSLVQMRLWTQARQMGAYAAQCMEAHSSKPPTF